MNDMPEPDRPRGIAPVPGGLPSGRLYTVAEVAQLMRLSRMSVYRLIHGGQLEAVQFGRSFRVTETALNEYLSRAFYDAG